MWLDDNSDVDDFTREDDDGEEVAKYVGLATWREMQQGQESFEFVGPPKHNPMPVLSDPVFDDLRI